MNNVISSIFGKQDAAIAAVPLAPVVPVVPVAASRSINPLFPICCLAICIFLIAATIVLALIPLYVPSGSNNKQNVFTTIATTTTTATPAGLNLTFYGLTNQNQLLLINALNPGTILSTVTITGLNNADTVTNIDFRPATGQLYGTSNNQLYVINEDTGVARPIGDILDTTDNGDITFMEFDPTKDRIFVITRTGTTLVLNPVTGETESENAEADNDQDISIAFGNNVQGASTTTLYTIHADTDLLFREDQPGNPPMTQVGSGLGVDITKVVGYDIDPYGVALVCATVADTLQLYRLNLTSGTLGQSLGQTPQSLVSLAIPTARVAYAIQPDNTRLLIINDLVSGFSFVTLPITDLPNGETLLGLDMRPSNGQLYGLGSNSHLYTIDMSTGAATVVGAGAPFAPLLAGATFGFDFNPVVDQVRVVSDLGQNLRVDPDTGFAVQETDINSNINPPAPHVTALAYTNNVFNALTTVLYDIDTNSDQLLTQTPANTGRLTNVGPLGINVDGNNGFDIGGKGGSAFAALTVNGVTSIYRINLVTGAATLVPNSALPTTIRGFTLGLNV